jgi:hypothetical protein
VKFRVTLQDQDGLYDSVLKLLQEDETVPDKECPGLLERLRYFAEAWIQNGEYVTIEFDTDAGTATLVQEHCASCGVEAENQALTRCGPQAPWRLLCKGCHQDEGR